MSELTFPKPIWRKSPDGTVEIRYANDNIQYAAHQQAFARPGDVTVPEFGYGWSGRYIKQEFPKALHGPKRLSRKCAHFNETGEPCALCAEPQSLSVKNRDEMERALANGWSLTPIGTEVDPEEGPVTSPDFAPHSDNLDDAELPVKRGRGRPKRELAHA